MSHGVRPKQSQFIDSKLTKEVSSSSLGSDSKPINAKEKKQLELFAKKLRNLEYSKNLAHDYNKAINKGLKSTLKQVKGLKTEMKDTANKISTALVAVNANYTISLPELRKLNESYRSLKLLVDGYQSNKPDSKHSRKLNVVLKDLEIKMDTITEKSLSSLTTNIKQLTHFSLQERKDFFQQLNSMKENAPTEKQIDAFDAIINEIKPVVLELELKFVETQLETDPTRKRFDKKDTGFKHTIINTDGGPVKLTNDLIGQGEFGKVRTGIMMKTGQHIVVKKIGAQGIEATKNEARIQKKLSNQENIMKMLGQAKSVDSKGLPKNYIVMPMARFGDVVKLSKGIDHLPPDNKEAINKNVFSGLLTGLANMHLNHTYHKDVAARNILLDSNGDVSVTDFGLTREPDNTENKDHMITWTESEKKKCPMGYQSPEAMHTALSGGQYDGSKLDVWMGGMTMFKLYTGSEAIDKGNFESLAHAYMDNPDIYHDQINKNREFANVEFDSTGKVIDNGSAFDVMRAMLQPNPALRPSAEELQRMKFFNTMPDSKIITTTMTQLTNYANAEKNMKATLQQEGHMFYEYNADNVMMNYMKGFNNLDVAFSTNEKGELRAIVNTGPNIAKQVIVPIPLELNAKTNEFEFCPFGSKVTYKTMSDVIDFIVNQRKLNILPHPPEEPVETKTTTIDTPRATIVDFDNLSANIANFGNFSLKEKIDFYANLTTVDYGNLRGDQPLTIDGAFISLKPHITPEFELAYVEAMALKYPNATRFDKRSTRFKHTIINSDGGPVKLTNDLIGVGEFGKVRTGIIMRTGQHIVVKKIGPDGIPATKDEARIQKKLSGQDNIMSMLGQAESTGSKGQLKNYILMPMARFGDGVKLFHGLPSVTPENKEVLIKNFFSGLLNGVANMHENHTYHKDIADRNILLDSNGDVFVTDFGLTREPDNTENKDHMITWTESEKKKCPMGYQSPEAMHTALSGGQYDGSKLDVWMGGVTMFKLYTGSKAIDKGNFESLAHAYMDNPDIYHDQINKNREFANVKFDSTGKVIDNGSAFDVIRGMLEPDPTRRLSAKELQNMSYFKTTIDKGDLRNAMDQLNDVSKTLKNAKAELQQSKFNFFEKQTNKSMTEFIKQFRQGDVCFSANQSGQFRLHMNMGVDPNTNENKVNSVRISVGMNPKSGQYELKLPGEKEFFKTPSDIIDFLQARKYNVLLKT